MVVVSSCRSAPLQVTEDAAPVVDRAPPADERLPPQDLVAEPVGADQATSACGPFPDGGPAWLGPTECTNGLDDDGDGLVDGLDPECTSPHDRDEATFRVIIGDLDPCRSDCVFDGNLGQGDDQCEWRAGCDPRNSFPRCTAPTLCPSPTQRCRDWCLPLTPNGCDCFGCCQVRVNGTSATVLIGEFSSCASDVFGDTARCPACTQNPSCLNPCQPGEICFGGADVPPTPGEPAPRCAPGQIACGKDTSTPACLCPAGTYCVTGCCAAFP
jgi:hypothetical protein